MTILYFYGDNKAYDHSQVYTDDTQVPNPLPSNSTAVAPEQGLYGIPKWNDTTWVGITREEWLAQQTEAPTMPTTEQQLLMQQEKDIIQLKQLAMDQEAKIATLSKGSAK